MSFKQYKKEYAEVAKNLLLELESSYTKVTLVDAPVQNFTDHKIRKIQSLNPRWYRTIYKDIVTGYDYKKSRERNRKCGRKTHWVGGGNVRKRITNALKRISLGIEESFVCDKILHELIDTCLRDGYEVMGFYVEPMEGYEDNGI